MGRDYTINGIKLSFPVAPYPCQMAMMSKIIQGLKRGQNCLLESPTGSGKSLALLCASLAWQQAEAARVEEHNRKIDLEEQGQQLQQQRQWEQQQRQWEQQQLLSAGIGTVSSLEAQPVDPPAAVLPAARSPTQAPDDLDWPDDDLDDFKTTGVKKLRTSLPQGDDTISVMEAAMETPAAAEVKLSAQQPSKKKLKKPKIYFGTRTHKQIEQITRELKKTCYKHAKMTVLASREHACIHPEVSRAPDKNDRCRELRDPHNSENSCSFFSRTNAMLHDHSQLVGQGLDEAWPLEELVGLGRRIHVCPYYSARNLKEEADIIFCPYNYLIEPAIRESMEIDLRNQVLILDEAHNIEDSSRDAASQTFQQAHMRDAIRDLERCGSSPRQTQAECRDMARMLSHICQWVDRNSDSLDQYREFDRSCKVLTGTDMVAQLTCMGIGPETFPALARSFSQLMAEEMDTGEESHRADIQRLTSGTTTLLAQLVRELGFIYGDNMQYRDDFRIVVVKSMSRQNAPAASGGWLMSKRKSQQPEWTCALNFWCMNPAVVFAPIGRAVHSVIVASGTLSPLSTFQSELGTPFPIKLEATHVVKPDQVYVAAVSHGPRGGSMNATYSNSEQFSFQDELGELVLSVCSTVPNGVLCFFPSYSMMDKLTKRWQMTGVWCQLEACKSEVLCEPRRTDEFDTMMAKFRRAIADDDGGALLLAVCRGKLSEGVDFPDNSARAVITVGIPYPNVKDIQVDLKKRYNNANVSGRGLLSGYEWYGTQAYRALNQALGRCIRHRYDWGAILLVDDRFGRGRGCDGLSRWMRSMVRHQTDWGATAAQLRQFAAGMQRWTEERRQQQREEQRQLRATAEASRLPVSAAEVIDLTLAEPYLPLAAAVATPPMSPASTTSAGAAASPPVVGLRNFEYASPSPGGATGGKVVLVPLANFARSADEPRQEIVTVDGRRCLRLTDERGTRLIPLLTRSGQPATASAHPPAAASPLAAGKRDRPASSGSAESGQDGAPGAASPPLFEDDSVMESARDPAAVGVAGKRPMFRPNVNQPAQAGDRSPEIIRKAVLTSRGSTRRKRSKGVVFSSDEEG